MDHVSIGTFRAAYNQLNIVPGDYQINILVDSKLIGRYGITTIAGSNELNIRRMLDIRQCLINGPSEEELTVYLRDYNGRPCEGVCAVDIEGPNGPVETKLEVVNLGSFRARYN